MDKKYKDGIMPIVLSINKNRQIVSGNPNVIVDIATPSSSGFTIGYAAIVDTNQDYIALYFRDIVRNVATGQNVKSLERIISDSVADYLNPPHGSSPAYVFMSNYSTITSFEFYWVYANGGVNSMLFNKPHQELLTIKAVKNIRSLHAGLLPSQNIDYLPKLRMFSGTYSSVLQNLPSLMRLYVNISFTTAINTAFLNNFLLLRELSGLIVGLDLKNFWNGNPNRMSVNMDNFTGTSVTYSGGAKFPSVFSDIAGYGINYIYYHGENTGSKLTGTALSRFIVDFANQVTSVTSVNKRMRFVGSTADENYTDISQPHFTTYIAARAFITNTLGINLTFN